MAESENIAQGWPPLPPTRTGLSASCPRCGEGRLFTGLLTPAKRCANCGLDYGFIDSGDGPAVFVILIMGFVLLGAALALDSVLGLPLWAQAVIWLPVTAIVGLWALRVTKSLMISLQYATAAREGRRES